MISAAFPYKKQRHRVLGRRVRRLAEDERGTQATSERRAGGAFLAGGKVLEQARSLPAQTEVTIKGVYFVQEDSPDEIGKIANWMKQLN